MSNPRGARYGTRLTTREMEVVHLLLDGRYRREIADLLAIRDETVKTYIRAIFIRTGARTMAQAMGAVVRRMHAQELRDLEKQHIQAIRDAFEMGRDQGRAETIRAYQSGELHGR